MGNFSVLVIEDNMDNLDLIRFLLEEVGHTVLIAIDGATGLDAARQKQPDLILMDLTLPEIDGWKLAQMLKADERTKHIPIVAITAHTLPGDRKRAFDAGCDGYITKPLDIPMFAQQVAQFVK